MFIKAIGRDPLNGFQLDIGYTFPRYLLNQGAAYAPSSILLSNAYLIDGGLPIPAMAIIAEADNLSFLLSYQEPVPIYRHC